MLKLIKLVYYLHCICIIFIFIFAFVLNYLYNICILFAFVLVLFVWYNICIFCICKYPFCVEARGNLSHNRKFAWDHVVKFTNYVVATYKINAK